MIYLDLSYAYRIRRRRPERSTLPAVPVIVMVSCCLVNTDRAWIALSSKCIFVKHARALPPIAGWSIHFAPVWPNGWSLFPPSAQALVIVNKNDHPDADLPITAEQRSAMDPSVAPVLIGSCNPSHLCCYSTALSKRRGKLVTDSR